MFSFTFSPMRKAFTLVELLVVISIIALLSAILLPVFFTVRGRARQTTCVSNLRQVALAVSMYGEDYDGYFPYGVDPSDKADPSVFGDFPAFAADIPRIAMVEDTLQPYVKSKGIFACPSDFGFVRSDFTDVVLNAYPSSFEKYGTSYFYRTELAALHVHDSQIQNPTNVNVLFDTVGFWHGNVTPRVYRYNSLFADGHVKNMTREGMDEAWATPVQ